MPLCRHMNELVDFYAQSPVEILSVSLLSNDGNSDTALLCRECDERATNAECNRHVRGIEELNRAAEQRRVADFNAKYPVGSLVHVYRTTRFDDMKTTAPTRSAAFIADSGDAVIFVEGVRAYWSLDAIRPATEVRHV